MDIFNIIRNWAAVMVSLATSIVSFKLIIYKKVTAANGRFSGAKK